MSGYSVFRFKNQALMVALAAAYPALSYSAGAARVDFAAGSVMAVSAAGAQRAVAKGAEIGSGEAVVTGSGGRAQLRFTDGALISLQPGTEFKINNYQYSGKGDSEEKGFFSLIKGGMRTITGLIGRSNRNNYQVSTSVATIGIRGTEYTAGLNPAGSELLVHTGEGLVEVCNGAGCVLLGSGESGSVQGQQQPKRTESRPQLPPAQPDPNVMPLFSTGDVLGGLLIPTSPMPTTGTAKYETNFSGNDGAVQTSGTAQLSYAKIDVNFAAANPITQVQLQGNVSSQAFTASASSLGLSGNTFSTTSPSVSGAFCGCGCTGSISGTFYGTGASSVGINYSVNNGSVTGSGAVLGIPKK
jgi:hypothetical protein